MGNKIPDNWVETELGNYIYLKNGYAYKTSQFRTTGIPILKISNITRNGKVDIANPQFVDERDLNPLFLVRKGDIVIAMSGATTGKFGIYESNELLLQNQRVGNIKLRSEINGNKRFVYYLIGYLKKEIEERAYGGAQPNISPALIESIKILLPPLQEQERIVAKLNSLFAQYESMKKALEQIPQLLKDFRQQVLVQAVTGKLTEEWRKGKDLESGDNFLQRVIEDRNENDHSLKKKLFFSKIDDAFDIPKEWSFSYLQNLGEFTRGKSKHRPRNDKKLFGGKYPFIQTGDVSNAVLYINDFKNTYSEFGLSQSRLFPKGTLCITVAANIAETAILNFEACFPDSVVGYIPFKNLYTSEFAMYFINTVQQELEHYAPATAQKNINMAILLEVPFPIPPLQEQQEIVSRVKDLFTISDRIEKKYKLLKAKIQSLPQAILHKAFKGELVGQLPTDGDARDLLEEINALKEKVNKK